MRVTKVEGKDTFHMEYDKFFCVCHHCGSMAWTDSNEESNELDEDGDMLIEKDLWNGMEEGKYFCHECEKPLKPLMFHTYNKKERKRVYKMSMEKRANWMKSHEIVDVLEKDNENNGY